MKKNFLLLTVLILIALFPVSQTLAGHPDHDPSWVWKSTAAVAGNPDILHTIWEMARPPYGPYDKIALHRFAYEGKNWRKRPHGDKVLLHLPGTWDTAWKGITDSNFENHLFFADRGYDVYSLDYRTSYLPDLPYTQELEQSIGSAAYWTYGLFREDIKACVEKIKRTSHARRLFLSGFSRGGTHMWIYASKYGHHDLKGLIGLDGGSPFAGTTPKRSTAEYDAAVNAFLSGGRPLLTGSTTFDGFCRIQFSARFPYAQKTVGYGDLRSCLTGSIYYGMYGEPPVAINVISDLQAYFYNFVWNDRFGPIVTDYGILTNYYEGQMDLQTLIKAEAGMTLYWPAIQNIERIDDLDYADNVAKLKLPVLFFGGILSCGYDGSRCTLPTLKFKCASPDITVVTLPAFGHMDVMWGLNSREKVKEPMLEWMNNRR